MPLPWDRSRNQGSPALSMKMALLVSGTIENTLENEHRLAGRRPCIIESAGEPKSGLSRTFDDPRPPTRTGVPILTGFSVVPGRIGTIAIRSAGEPKSEPVSIAKAEPLEVGERGPVMQRRTCTLLGTQ
jgi:hypothetical protein